MSDVVFVKLFNSFSHSSFLVLARQVVPACDVLFNYIFVWLIVFFFKIPKNIPFPTLVIIFKSVLLIK